jgi:GT2 family glycosyltransferase
MSVFSSDTVPGRSEAPIKVLQAASCRHDHMRAQRETLVLERGPENRATTRWEMAAVPILIVAYRNVDDMVCCLHALRRARVTPAFEVFVCENGGADAYQALVAALLTDSGPCETTEEEERLNTPQLTARCVLRLKGHTSSPKVHVGLARENLGYAGGVNAWLRPLMDVPGWPAAWILNPDTQPAPDALLELAAYAAQWGKGMVGSRLVPTTDPNMVHSRGLAWYKSRAAARSVDLRAPGNLEPDPQAVDRRLDSPSGASMYVTRRCIEEIGLMNELYFLYFEDLEWGVRAKRRFGIGYAHRAIVVHTGGTTIGGSINTRDMSPLSVFLEYRNSLLFVRQNFHAWFLWTILIQLVRVALKARSYRRGNIKAALSGMAAGIYGRRGRPDHMLRAHTAVRSKQIGSVS